MFYHDYLMMMKDERFNEVDYVIICTPNFLHHRIARAACEKGKKVIVEKPTVIKLSDLEDLKRYSDKVNCILQLRKNPDLIKRREEIAINTDAPRYQATFEVAVHRDSWYFDSWKNKKHESGGLAFNIGAHYFDLLTWFFGEPTNYMMNESEKGDEVTGIIEFKNCDAGFRLTIAQPMDNQFRYLKVNGEEIDLTRNFEGLHTKIYKDILANKPITLDDVEPSIKLIKKLYGTCKLP